MPVRTYAFGLLKHISNRYSFILHYTVHNVPFISLQGTLMKPAVSIVVVGFRGGWVTMMTRGLSTSNGSQTVSTFDTLWRGTSNALMMIAT